MKKRAISYILTICMVFGLFAGIELGPIRFGGTMPSAQAANYWDGWTELTTQSTTKTLGSGNYKVTAGNVSISGAAGANGITISSGAAVTIYIAAGRTLTVTGGNGSGATGGGAGIEIPGNSSLHVLGEGVLSAKGGDAGSGGNGAVGSSAYKSGANSFGGTGGGGGAGGGGAGAAIGTRGGTGGTGGSSTSFSSAGGHTQFGYPRDQNSTSGSYNNGVNGNASSAMGTLFVTGSITINATAGLQGGNGGGGAGGGSSTYYVDGNWVRSAAAGGGGGGGGGGARGAAIGTGGGGGGGGGGGATGAVTATNVGTVYYVLGVGGNGGGGGWSAGGTRGTPGAYDNGVQSYQAFADSGLTNTGGKSTTRASITSTKIDTGSSYSGYPGKGGNVASAAAGGAVYAAPTVTVNLTVNGYSSNGNGTAASFSTPAAYTIAYNASGGSLGSIPVTQTKYGGITEYIDGNAPTRTGYSFLGWATGAGSATVIYAPGAACTADSNLALFAVWQAKTSAITLNLQGGAGAATHSATYDADLTGIEPPTRAGYSFDGYFSQTSGGVKVFGADGTAVPSASGYTNAGKWIYDGNPTLYAGWTAKTYNVSFVMGEMIGNPASATKTADVIFGQTFSQPVVPPKLSTHNFAGYYSQAGGNGVKFFNTDGSPAAAVWNDPGENPRLYAAWDKKPVAAALQNGSFETPAVNSWTKMLAQGTQELYWKTTASDGIIEFARPRLNAASALSAYNTSYAAEGEQFAELNANVPGALYQTIETTPGDALVWGLSHHGRNGTDTMEVWIGAPASVLAACQEYTKGGNNVNKVSNRNALKSDPITGVNEAGTSTLTGAKTISSNKDQWYRYTGSYTVPAGQTQTTFAFVSVSASGNNPSVGNLLDNIYFCHTEEIPAPTAPVTVNPPASGGVNVLVDGCVVDTAEGSHTVSIHPGKNDKVTFQPVPKDAEYISIGAIVNGSFVDSNTFTSAEYTGPLEVTVLFAKKGMVILDPAGGTYQGQSGEVKLTVTAGNDVLIPASAQKTGLRFTGWAVAPSLETATSIAYKVRNTTAYLVAYNGTNEVASVPTETSGLVLIAQYDLPVIPVAAITFAMGGGTLNGLPYPESSDMDVVYTLNPANTSLTLGTPVREGYSFAGWNGSDGNIYAAGQTFIYAVDANYAASLTLGGVSKDLALTLTAGWSVTPRSVTLVLNGGSVTSPPASYTPGTELTLPDPTKTGYLFDGWYGDNTLTPAGRLDNGKIPANASGDKVYYAGWTLCDHTGNITPASCTAATVCSRCGGSIPASGHRWGSYIHDAVSETCHSYGTKTAVCLRDDSHRDTVQDTDTTLAAHTFGPSELVVVPSCQSDGMNKETCSVCGYERYTPVDAMGHSAPTGAYTVLTAATCTESGQEVEYCTNTAVGGGDCEVIIAQRQINPTGHHPSASWSSDSSGHWHTCENGCGALLDKAPHSPVSGGEIDNDINNPLNSVFCSECHYPLRAAKYAVTNTGGSGGVTYDGAGIPTASRFTRDLNAGTPTYYLIPSTAADAGTGAVDGSTGVLTVTKAGVFLVGMTTAAAGDYLAGAEAVYTMTVNKASQDAPSPVSISASKWGELDGGISSLTAGAVYEIRIKSPDNSELWRTVTAGAGGALSGLGAGTYEIRLAGNDLYETGNVAEVTVTQPLRTFSITYFANIPAGQGSFTPTGSDLEYTCDITAGSIVTLPQPSRTGHTFDGWYENESFSGGRVTAVDGKTDSGNKTFYAKWTANTYTVTLTTPVNGTVTVPSDAVYDSDVSVAVTPRTGFELDVLVIAKSGGGNISYSGTESPYAFTMPDSNVTVTATFKETAARKAVGDSLSLALQGPWVTGVNTAAELSAWIADQINAQFAADGVASIIVLPENITLNAPVYSVYGMPGLPGSFGFTLTLSDSTLGDWSEAVTGGVITAENRIAGTQSVTIPVPVKNGTPPGIGGVTLANPLSGYAECADISWNPEGGGYMGETVYTAAVSMTAKQNALFEPSFTPLVPGGTAKNVSIAPSGMTVTFDVVFPATGAKIVTGLTVHTPSTHDGDNDRTPDHKYMAGDPLSLAGLVVRVSYDDGTGADLPLSSLPGAYITIGGQAEAFNTILNKAHDGAEILLHYAGQTVSPGTLTVFNPPVLHLSAVYGMTVSSNTVAGGKTDLGVISGDSPFSYVLSLDTATVLSGSVPSGSVSAPETGLGSLTPDILYTLKLSVVDSALGRTYTLEKIFRTPAIVPHSGHTVGGSGLNPSDDRILISLIRGGEILATVFAVQPQGQSAFSFTFENVPEGIYNLVADNGHWIVTYGIAVDENGATDKSIFLDMSAGMKQSVLSCLPGSPVVIADGLPSLFGDNAIYTAQDAALINGGGMVEIELVTSGENGVTQADKETLRLQSSSQGKETCLFLDLSLLKSTYDANGVPQTTERLTSIYTNTLTVTIELPPLLAGRTGLAVYRIHDGQPEQIPQEPEQNGNGECFRLDGNLLTLTLSRFSPYVLAFDPITSSSSRPPATSKPSSSPELSGQPTSTPAPAAQATGDVSKLLNTDDHMAYMFGDNKGMFNPEKNLTRAEAAQLFYNLLRDKTGSGDKNFADVSHKAWYAKAVTKLASLGIISGYPDGTFGPQASVTRAEFAAMAVRFAQTTTDAGRSFTDVPEHHWAYRYIQSASTFGWINGVGSGRFEPDRNILRAEAAAIVNRMLLRSPDRATIEKGEGLKSFPDLLSDKWYYYDVMEAVNSHGYIKSSDGSSETWKK